MTVQTFGLEAIDPVPVNPAGINPDCRIPHGVTSDHILSSLADFVEFLGFMNRQLIIKDVPRLEAFLMPAAFSSLVGEFMNVHIPRFCPGVVKNRYHNGHPDLIPAGHFPSDAVQHSTVGIEVKGSRNRSGWQGHNPENVWLMVFVFDANSANDEADAVKRAWSRCPDRSASSKSLARNSNRRIGYSTVGSAPAAAPSPPPSGRAATPRWPRTGYTETRLLSREAAAARVPAPE